MHINLDMLGYSTHDAWLTRRMSPAQLRALTAEDKAERRRAQHRVFRARQTALVAYYRRRTRQVTNADA